MNTRALEEDLKKIVDGRVTTDPFQCWFYGYDFVSVPALARRLFRTTPDAVVKPATVDEVVRLVRYCREQAIPLVPRGGGSSGLFAAVPKKGGVVADLRGLRGIADLKRDEATVQTGAGITWWELEKQLQKEGCALRSYPSSARSATVGGWIMGTGLGIGSLKYQALSRQLLSAKVVLGDGSVREVKGDGDLQILCGSEGRLAILTDATVHVRAAPAASFHQIVVFAHMEDLFGFFRSLLARPGSPRPFAAELFDGAYMEWLRASGFRAIGCPDGGGVALVTYEGDAAEVLEGQASVHSLVKMHNGREEEGGDDEWEQRFNILRVRKAHRTVFPSMVYVPLSQCSEFTAALSRLRKRPLALTGHLMADDTCLFMPLVATDETKFMEYLRALAVPWKVAGLAIGAGGKPGGGVGVWNAPQRTIMLSKERIDEIEQRRKEWDPSGILNPGMWEESPLLFQRGLFGAAMALTGVAEHLLPPYVPERVPESLEGDFASCVQCGYCMGYCPTREDWVSSTPRGRILMTRQFLHRGGLTQTQINEPALKSIFQCTLCGRCKVDCSVSVNSPAMWADLRAKLAGKGLEPEGLKTVARVIAETGNIAGKANDQRGAWTRRLKLGEDPEKKQSAEILYFTGCVSAFFPMVQDIARSFVQVLDRAGVNYAILGGREVCCGYPQLSAGHRDEAVASLRRNIGEVRKLEVKTVVVTCPGCLRMWKEEYPRLAGEETGIEALHSTEFLAQLVDEGALNFRQIDEVVTYHDPCDLGRVGGIFEAPRRVLRSIPGVTLVELEENRERCSCCGSGGDFLMTNQELSLSIARNKVKEGLSKQATTMVTACPSCVRAITMAKNNEKADLNVLDISQFAWKAMIK
jgi:Fe-S oxidoreductase/FAD/FMN-containing dehydrogenase